MSLMPMEFKTLQRALVSLVPYGAAAPPPSSTTLLSSFFSLFSFSFPCFLSNMKAKSSVFPLSTHAPFILHLWPLPPNGDNLHTCVWMVSSGSPLLVPSICPRILRSSCRLRSSIPYIFIAGYLFFGIP
jgi:hypothetical protein